jgi:hypothetical protein
MRKLTRHLLFAALLALTLSATAGQARAQSPLGPPDLAVMQELQTTYGWGPIFGWPPNTNPCLGIVGIWNGVSCNQGRVVQLDVICGTTLLNAPIPPILAQLTALMFLQIGNCGLTGPIPDALASLTPLVELRLEDNVLTGSIPAGLATSEFTELFLTNNQLTGAIPQFYNSDAVVTRLAGNFLTSIPAGWTGFDRDVSYNCYPSLPPTCDSQSATNECTPNRQECPSAVILSKVSGDGQRTQIDTAFANPLVVSVTDFSANPVAGVTVTFSGPGISTVTAITDGNGNATANVAANSTVGGNTITASTDPNTMAAFGLTAGAAATCGTDIVVTSNAASGPGSLMEALADVCPGGTVDLSGIGGQTIALSSGAPSYNFGGRLYIATDVTIQGSGVTIDGSGATRIFFVQNGNVTLNNMTLADGLGQGGNSELGGSAAGLGGAIFENNGNLTLNGVVLSGNQAVGGSADNSGNGAGGGFGANSTGGDLGGAQGTSDGAGGIAQAVGGIGGFGGGGGQGTGTASSGEQIIGGDGGFGGGGGFGLGTQITPVGSGIAGYGGGQGSATIDGGNPGGGGGAGFGGAIFVYSGALNLNNVTFSGNSAVGGTGAQGKGGSLFLYNGASFNMVPNSVTFTGDVAAAASAPGQGYSAGPYNNNATCPGVDTVDICGIVPTNTLTVSVAGNGAVTDSTGLINCPSGNCAALFQNSAVLNPVPAEGFVFSGWSGGGCSGLGACTVSLAGGNVSVTASFVSGSIQIANGSSPNLGSTAVCASAQAVGCGATTTLTFNVDEFVPLTTANILTQGIAGLDFNLAPNGFNCASGQCTVQVNFTPLAPGLRLGAIQFVDADNHVLKTSYISGVGSAPLIDFAPAASQTLPFTGVDHPLSLAVDASGDVFVGDYENRVLELPAGGGSLTTVPVTGLNRAFGVAVDGAGDVFIADYYNQQVLEVPAGGGTQVTLPLTGLQGPSGLAVDGAGDVFVSDTSNQVLELPAGGGAQIAIGSGWNNPRGLAVDGAGDVFVADNGSGNLLEVPAGNSQTVTVAGGFNGPIGIAVDAAGDVFVADTGNNRVVQVPVGGCPQAGCPTVGSGFNGPWGVALDGAGDIFVADTNDSQVVEVLRSQAPTLTFQSAPFGGVSSDSPRSVTVRNTGNASLAVSGLSIGSNFTQTLLNGTPPDCTGSSSLASGTSCNLSISFTPTAIGPLTASAMLTDNSLDGSPAVQTIALSGTGTQADTSTGVVSSANPSVYGQGVYFTAAVTPGAATGSVQFQIDGVNFGAPVTLAGGQASSGTISTLAVGGHAVAAIYSGDIDDITSTGNLTQTVNDASASVGVALTTGSNPSAYGTSLTFTATLTGQYGQVGTRSKGVHSRVVTGTVIWSANTGCGATPLTAGAAICTTSALPGGSDTVTATYGGDGNHNGNSGTVNQTVSQQAPVVTVTSVNPASEGYGAGTPTVVTATLTWTGGGATPTGALTFNSNAGGSFVGSPSCGANATTITCTQTFNPAAADAVGTYTISASYASDGNYNSAGSAQTNNFAIQDAGASVGVSLTTGSNPSTYGTPVTFTATVAGQYGQVRTRSKGVHAQIATGSVSWSANTGCGATPLTAGAATCTTSVLPGGPDTVTATYGGDGNHNGNSGSVKQTVNLQTPVPTVTSVNPASEGYGTGTATVITATLNWTGSGAAPTGGITFKSTAGGGFTGSPSCSQTNATTITCTQTFDPTTADAVGTYTMSAGYTSNGNYNSANSTQTNNFSITQTKVTPKVTITSVTPGAEPYGLGLSAIVTATLSWTGSGPAPTAGKGALLSFSSTAAGTFAPVACLGKTSPIICGTLFTPAASDSVATYTIGASYAGDSNYNAASSAQTNNFSVTADTPAVKLTPNPASVTYSSTAAVTLTAAFSGAGSSDAAPTGTITFGAATGTFSGESCSSSKDVLTCTVSYDPSGTLAAGTYSNYLTASIAAAGEYKAAEGFATLTVAKPR